MKFVFWQNIISIHQSAFLKALANKHDVTLIVEQSIKENRKVQGWNIPVMNKIKIIIAPEIIQINELLDNNSIHIFSGINAFPLTTKVFKLAVKKKLRIGVMLEPFQWIGFKGKLRWIKYLILRLRYKLKINFILTTGNKGYNQYKLVGFCENDIFEWGYFIDPLISPISLSKKENRNIKPSVLFVGRIDKNKNIDLLTKLIIKHYKLIEKFTIIGDGPHNEHLQSIIKDLKYIDYKGVLTNSEVQKLMHEYDILILPSQYDGWGAVVNEALIAGTPVIASENCGAADLLDGQIRGEKFYFSGKNNLESVLTKWLLYGKVPLKNRKIIQDWSTKNISGESASNYFIQIVDFNNDNSVIRPVAPWLVIE